MAQIVDQLSGLRAQFQDFVADVQAKLEQLAAAQGEFQPEALQIFDDLKQSLADADAKVGDADGSDTPTQPIEPGTPVEEPANPGDPSEPVGRGDGA